MKKFFPLVFRSDPLFFLFSEKTKNSLETNKKKVTSLETDIIKGYGPGILTTTINEAPATFIAIKTKNRDKKFLVA